MIKKVQLLVLTLLCLMVALGGVILVLAQEETRLGPIGAIFGRVIVVAGDDLLVQNDAGQWSFRLTAETQYRASDVYTSLDHIGVVDTVLNDVQVGDSVAVIAQLDEGEQSGSAWSVVVLPAEATSNLPPAIVQPTSIGTTQARAQALPCRAQIDGLPTIYTSPQAAVDSANDGDVIKISGICSGVSERQGITQTVYVNSSLTLIGGYDAGFSEPPDPDLYPTLLDAQGEGRVLVVTDTVQVRVEGLTLTDGSAAGLQGDLAGSNDVGGNIYAVAESTLIIVNSTLERGYAGLGGGLYLSGTAVFSGTTVSGNYANTGGAIYNTSGPISITRSIFQNNIGVGVGGGVLNESGPIDIANSTFSGHYANGSGAAVLNGSGAMDISDSTFDGNITPSTGGGVTNGNGPLTIASSTFSNHYVAGAGAAVINSGPMVVDNSIFIDNRVSGSGGGISNNGPATITNSTFSGNVSQGFGGGVSNYGTLAMFNSTLNGQRAAFGSGIRNNGVMSLTNTTVSGNRAFLGSGGGVYNASGSTLAMTNTTIMSNSSSASGAGIYNFDATTVLAMTNSVIGYHSAGGDCGGDFTQATSNGYNLAHDTTCTFLIATNDISDTEPLFGPLQDNGGLTETHLPQIGSPAVDSANPAACPSTDQRGISRPQDGDGDGNPICDRGAVEIPGNVYLPLILRGL